MQRHRGNGVCGGGLPHRRFLLPHFTKPVPAIAQGLTEFNRHGFLGEKPPRGSEVHFNGGLECGESEEKKRKKDEESTDRNGGLSFGEKIVITPTTRSRRRRRGGRWKKVLVISNGGRGIFGEKDEKKTHSPIVTGSGFGFSGESETHSFLVVQWGIWDWHFWGFLRERIYI